VKYDFALMHLSLEQGVEGCPGMATGSGCP